MIQKKGKKKIRNLFLGVFAMVALWSCEPNEPDSIYVNTAPVIKAYTFSVAENINDTSVIGTVTATDVDEDALVFSIAANSDDLFEITKAGALSLASGKTLDFATKSQHVLSIGVYDGTVTAKADVTINVTEVTEVVDPENQSPVIQAQGFEAAEDIADTDVIGTVVATDPEQDALTFSITTNDDDIFEITTDGELSLALGKTLDFGIAESHAITVGVSDGNSSATATITINVDDAPVIQAQGFEAAEDIADTDVIGAVVATDAEDDALTFSITTNDNDLFEITTDGELSLAEGKALNFETAEGHTITVDVTDGVNNPVSAEITITVTNVIETLAEDPDSFVTTWVTTANNETIVIGVDNTFTYDYTIDWGDGTVENITDNNDPQHLYVLPGAHTVAIKGAFPAIRMVNGNLVQADRDKLVSIEQWGTNLWASMADAFRGCQNLANYNATDVPDLSQVSDMTNMFRFAETFNGDLSGWDVSNVTDMSDMFHTARVFEGIGLSGWDTGNVSNMFRMFYEAFAFNADLSGWDVSNVTNMGSMFAFAVDFNADLSGWDTGNVTYMVGMFFSANDFNSDLGAWDISGVTDMTVMLNGAALSPNNYSATLQGWATQVQNNNGPSNVVLDAEFVYYCNTQLTQNARNLLLNNFGWTITDEGGTNMCN